QLAPVKVFSAVAQGGRGRNTRITANSQTSSAPPPAPPTSGPARPRAGRAGASLPLGERRQGPPVAAATESASPDGPQAAGYSAGPPGAPGPPPCPSDRSGAGRRRSSRAPGRKGLSGRAGGH